MFTSYFTKDIDPFILLFPQTFPKATQPGHLPQTKPHLLLSLLAAQSVPCPSPISPHKLKSWSVGCFEPP